MESEGIVVTLINGAINGLVGKSMPLVSSIGQSILAAEHR